MKTADHKIAAKKQIGRDRYVAMVDGFEIMNITFETEVEALAYASRVAELTPFKHDDGRRSAYRRRWDNRKEKDK